MSSNMENVLPVYGFAVKPEGGGGATPEQIQQAVDNYLNENPVTAGELELSGSTIKMTEGGN